MWCSMMNLSSSIQEKSNQKEEIMMSKKGYDIVRILYWPQLQLIRNIVMWRVEFSLARILSETYYLSIIYTFFNNKKTTHDIPDK